MAESQIPRQILRTVELIKKHPGVADARMLHDQSTADWTSVAVDVTVELPSRSMAHDLMALGPWRPRFSAFELAI
jgi:hypothetical protein